MYQGHNIMSIFDENLHTGVLTNVYKLVGLNYEKWRVTSD